MIGMAILNIAHGAYTRVLLIFSVVLMYMAQVFYGISGDVTVPADSSAFDNTTGWSPDLR